MPGAFNNAERPEPCESATDNEDSMDNSGSDNASTSPSLVATPSPGMSNLSPAFDGLDLSTIHNESPARSLDAPEANMLSEAFVKADSISGSSAEDDVVLTPATTITNSIVSGWQQPYNPENPLARPLGNNRWRSLRTPTSILPHRTPRPALRRMCRTQSRPRSTLSMPPRRRS
jgi:hypothetical protein